MEANIKVLTLNCWGLKYVSKLRKERFRAIAEYLAQYPGSSYDVIFLQEVWVNEDYEDLKAKLTADPSLYPYSHYFDNGIIGSGTCIFSKVRLQDANYHEFAMNGYPTNFWHGDWFASKGIGVCQIRLTSTTEDEEHDIDYFDIHLYVSHYHANYDPTNDIYLGHRVIHAFESAQWIKLASSSADLTIYAGDFNTEPFSLPYRILRNVATLKDAWESCLDTSNDNQLERSGFTNEIPENSFSTTTVSRNSQQSDIAETSGGNGVRIDYIMYSAGPDTRVTAQSCSKPLPTRVPGQSYSFSDHEAVDAVLKIVRRDKDDNLNGLKQVTDRRVHHFKKARSIETRLECVKSVQEAIKVMDRSLEDVDRSQKKYAVYALSTGILLLLTFAPSAIKGLEVTERIVVDISLYLPRLLLSTALIIFALMGTLFSKRERNAFRAVKNQLQLIVHQDIEDQTSENF